MPVNAQAMRKAALESERAMAAFNAGLAQYQDACRRGDMEILPQLHTQTMTALESFLDNLGAGAALLARR